MAVRPLKDGVIADFDVTEAMLRYFIDKASEKRYPWTPRPRVVVCVPSGVTSVEKRAVFEATIQAGARQAYLIEEPMAAAIGADLPVEEPTGSMVIDIGGGTTEVAVIAMGGIVVSQSIRIAGDEFDQAILTHVRDAYNLAIGERTAEDIKIKVGSAVPLKDELDVEVNGRDVITGLPKTVRIESEEIRRALNKPLDEMAKAVKDALDATPPDLASDLMYYGILLTGGGALLRGLDVRLEGLVGLQSTYNLKSTAARIVGASGDAWTSTVTIDKGSADGLTINMPVTSSAGVIGQIIEVSAKTSTVRLIGDENSGVSAMVQDTRAQGMLQGQPDGTLRLEYVSVDSDVKVGDIIVTSGIGGVFPKGLPLGTVSSVEKSANDVYYTIVVRAQTTAENNEEVLVITSLTDEQSASDEDVSTANSTPQGTSRGAATKMKDGGSDESSDSSETTDSGSSE